MDITNDRLAQLLAEGRGVFLAGEGPLFLANDGSVYDNSGGMVLPPDAGRAAIVAGFGGINTYVLPVAGSALGGVKNGGNVVVAADGTMSVAVAGDALGLVKNGGNVAVSAEGTMSVPTAGSSLGLVKNGGMVSVASDGTMSLPGIVPLIAIAAAAPENPADGDKYGNSTDGKIYVAASGSWTEATGAAAAAAGILYIAQGLFYHWDETDGFSLI